MERNVTLEAEEWYVLTNWLRERENRLQYALRSRSREWAFVHELRRDIERQRRAEWRRPRRDEGERPRNEESEHSRSDGSERHRGEANARRRGDEGTRRPEPENGRGPERGESGRARARPGETDGAGAADGSETRGTTRTLTLSSRQVAYLDSFLRKRARRLLLRPWRDRERRDVRHLRDHLLAAAGPAERGERTDRGNGVRRNG